MRSLQHSRINIGRKSGFWRGWLFLIPLVALLGSPLRAAILSHWDPATLTQHSDLVVIGTLDEHSRVAVTEVLKGNTESRDLVIPSIGEFSEASWVNDGRPAVATGREVLLFLDQRSSPPRIVANGFFRIGKSGTQSGVFGYQQEMNPGPYVLSPTRKFESLAAVAEQVKEECGKIPATQLAALEKVKAAIPSNSFHSALDELCEITRRGDMDILKKVATLDQSFPQMDKGFLAGFIRDVQDPAALDLLIELDQRGGHFSLLQTIGSLGNPKAFDYFKSLLGKGREPEAYQVLWGLRELYLACERRGDLASCELVREEMYREVDKDLPRLMMMSPQLMSVIPHQGSIDRLQRAHDFHSKLANNAAYNINLHIAACRKKIAGTNSDTPLSTGHGPRIRGAETGYEFMLKKPGDSIAVTTDAQRTTFVITSKSGIGGAGIALATGAWPKHVALRLKGFKNLESFSLSTSRLRVAGSLKQSGKMSFHLADATGKFDPNDRTAGYLEIVVEQRNEGLEIILPAHLLVGSSKFEVGWIDAFR